MKPKNLLIIHHNKDLDGFFSGAIAKKAVLEQLIDEDFDQELVFSYGWDYSEVYNPPVKEGSVCIVTDISISKDLVGELAEGFDKVIIIDHHLSSYELEEIGKPENVELFLRTDFSAAELAWARLIEQHKDSSLVNPNTIPFAVKWIGSYDIHRDKNRDFWKTEIMPFQMGMRLIANSIDTVPPSLLNWSFVPPKEVYPVIDMGNTIINYEEFLTNNLIQKNSRIGSLTIQKNSDGEEGTTEKYSALWINNIHPPANITDIVKEKGIEVDLIICFNLAPSGLWVYSLRTTSESINCREIAKHFNGGGHKKAAGFQTTDLLCEAVGTEIFDSLATKKSESDIKKTETQEIFDGVSVVESDKSEVLSTGENQSVLKEENIVTVEDNKPSKKSVKKSKVE